MEKNESRVRLTAGRVADFVCPANKSQAFLWDTDAPTLALRASPTGRKTYVFEARLRGATIRITIGTAGERGYTLEKARQKAQVLKMLVDDGKDPRELERQRITAEAEANAAAVARVESEKLDAIAQAQADEAASITVGEVWAAYLAERRPHWGDLHYRDHEYKAKAGGQPSARRGGKGTTTKPGPLFPLMGLPLRELDAATIEAWAAKEGQTRATSARLAWRLLTVFLTWCSEQPAYTALLPIKNPGKTRKARESLGKPATKSDVLQRGQLKSWFEQVRRVQNRTISAALQVMLLTGARPGEVLSLRWEDVNSQWKGITIRDKVEGTREIPLTPYVAQLLAALPRANDWIFASARWVNPIRGKPGAWANTSASGRIAVPNNPHTRACNVACLEGLTLHGLRRSFASLTEWLEIPAGVVAQIQGHKPSATAEKHYKRRPLELLALHHERIEAWMLEQAGVQFDAKAVTPVALQLVTSR
ncbi:MAG: integrase family protein [Pseudomonadota bacterium]|nr:integrase family protein [Pseudomonadota bacterium]